MSALPTLKKKRLATSLLITLNLLLLIYFKYANFLVENTNSLLGLLHLKSIHWAAVALPIGISFYTFHTITYVVDVYRGVDKPLQNIKDYLLYLLAFPHLIAGPIIRFSVIADQLTERKETIDDRLAGFYRFAIGLAKKVLIANVMAEQADLIFNGNIDELNSGTAWLGMVAYTFQIYFDFSGYTDMAIGLGRMIGFRFPENFNFPYTSRSITEFWRRWHITLGDFMRDYLYIPLGGNRVSSKFRLYFNLWIVFILSGLWHGASWNFVIWGCYHGVFMAADRLFFSKLLKQMGAILSTIITFIIVMVGWVIFRLESLPQTIVYIKKLFIWQSFEMDIPILSFNTTLIIAVIFSFLGAFTIGDKLAKFAYQKEKYNLATHFCFSLIAIAFVILSIGALSTSSFNPFIYFRF